MEGGKTALSPQFMEFLLIPATFGIFVLFACVEEQRELVGQRVAVHVLGEVFLPS